MATRPICNAVLVPQPQSFCGKNSFPTLFHHCFTQCIRRSALLQGKTISLLHVTPASPEAMQKIGREKIWINLISNSQPFRWPLGASKNFGRHWTDSYGNSSAFHHQHRTVLCSQDREKADFLEISLLAQTSAISQAAS